VDFSDFLPTCLEASGINVPKELDGQSFWPQLQGERGNPRESIFCYYCPRPEKTAPIRFVRDQRFKLYGDGRFFDVRNDVLEQEPLTDLQDRTAAQAARARLRKALDAMPSVGQALLKFK
jgi:arylsulfatase A